MEMAFTPYWWSIKNQRENVKKNLNILALGPGMKNQ